MCQLFEVGQSLRQRCSKAGCPQWYVAFLRSPPNKKRFQLLPALFLALPLVSHGPRGFPHLPTKSADPESHYHTYSNKNSIKKATDTAYWTEQLTEQLNFNHNVPVTGRDVRSSNYTGSFCFIIITVSLSAVVSYFSPTTLTVSHPCCQDRRYIVFSSPPLGTERLVLSCCDRRQMVHGEPQIRQNRSKRQFLYQKLRCELNSSDLISFFEVNG